MFDELSVRDKDYARSLFTEAYIDCALWASSRDLFDDTPLNELYSTSDISEHTLEEMREDCESFLSDYYEFVKDNLVKAGHNFWLSRNGHGAGFFDGNYTPALKQHLQEAARAYGEYHLYVGDDDLIYGG